uniref:FIP-RBD domain-containing protein n=1 Tax=Rhabditophanes sp. KR3021 TaxID=114890 RepID=A0AC35U4V5_9BILA
MAASEGNFMVQVVKADGLINKHHKPLNVSVILKVTGKGNWKSEVATDQVIAYDGIANWNQTCEFNLQPEDKKLSIHVMNDTKGDGKPHELLANISFHLEDLIGFEEAEWFPLKKTKTDTKDRGRLMMSFKFNKILSSAISMYSLNSFGVKESRIDKLKKKMHFGKKKSSKDTQSLASFSLSKRGSYASICSDALAFGSPSPVPTIEYDNQRSVSRKSSFSVSTHDNNLLSPAHNRKLINDNNISNGEKPHKSSGLFSSLGRKTKETFSDLYEHAHHHHGKSTNNNAESVSLYGAPTNSFSSNDLHSLNSSSGINSQAETTLSREEMYGLIQQLQRECSMKDEKITALRGYVEGLLTKVINTNPEILQR